MIRNDATNAKNVLVRHGDGSAMAMNHFIDPRISLIFLPPPDDCLSWTAFDFADGDLAEKVTKTV